MATKRRGPMVPRPGTLELTISIAARPATIFPLISTPEGFSRWLGAAVAFAPEKGSPFRVDFARFQTVVEGKVIEIVPRRRVVFTWGVAEGSQKETIPVGSTRVEIRLTPEVGGGTLVTLRHSGLPTIEEQDNHHVGWQAYLTQLSAHGCRDQHAPRLASTIDEFLAAWSETDPDRRLALIQGTCSPIVRFHDAHALVLGRDGIAAQIGNAQRFLPGARLSRTGDPQLTHHHVTFPWTITGGDGQRIAAGRNYAELDASGHFQQIVGFWEG